MIDNANEIPATLNMKTTETLLLITITRTDVAKILKKPCSKYYPWA